MSAADRPAGCEAIQLALAARALAPEARDEPGADDPALRAHVATCTACAAHEHLLARLAAPLVAPAPPAAAVVARTRERAARALRAHAPPPVPARALLGDIALALGVLTLALPLPLAHAWLVAAGASRLLGGLLPPLLLEGLGVFYFGSLALAVGVLYALLPVWVALARRARTEAPA